MDVESNLRMWGKEFDWQDEGALWSEPWGGVQMQWFFSIYPRIHAFVPAHKILEIAPGFGRWTQYLVNLCREIIVIDLSEKCIRHCRKKFKQYQNITYHVNDGKSLSMISDNSIDFVFSFDSLVHAEEDVISAYLHQLSKKMKKGGKGFIHHSNIGEYKSYYSIVNRMPHNIIKKALVKAKLLEATDHNRAFSMTALKFRKIIEETGMNLISQEIINWNTNKKLIDCFSVFSKGDTQNAYEPKLIANSHFMGEAKYIKMLSQNYFNKPTSQFS